MWISTKAQYGLRALIEIGKRPLESVSLKDVAQRQDLSQHYLEQIASSLRRAGFIRSVRGAYGGYQLAQAPEHISAWQVVTALEGSLAPVTCLDDETACSRVGNCATEGMWREVENAVRQVLEDRTLADLIAENVALEQRGLVQLEPSFAG